MPEQGLVERNEGHRSSEAEASHDSDLAVELRDVWKRYRLGVAPGARFRRALGFNGNTEGAEFTALRGINLRIRRGERVGLVGRNGAGKTTLLKLVSGRSAPSSGELRVRGEVQALMQLGIGFHDEFSGRVNIRSSLVHLGLADEELERAIDEVIEFVELGDHLDQPVRTYSLGMRTRLMFAAATAIRPDILLIDEILGAGDPYFTAKSADRVKGLVASGCTLLLVSHSPQQMLQFSDRVVWIDEGRIVQDGDAVDVLNAYEAHIEHSSERIFTPGAGGENGAAEPDAGATTVTLSDGREAHSFPGLEGLKIRRVDLNGAGLERPSIRTGEPTRIEFDVQGETEDEFAVRYIVSFWRSDGRRVARAENTVDRFRLGPGEIRTIRLDLGPMLLAPGEYTISFAVYDLQRSGSSAEGRSVRYDLLSRPIRFVVEGDGEGTREPLPAVSLPANWRPLEVAR